MKVVKLSSGIWLPNKYFLMENKLLVEFLTGSLFWTKNITYLLTNNCCDQRKLSDLVCSIIDKLDSTYSNLVFFFYFSNIWRMGKKNLICFKQESSPSLFTFVSSNFIVIWQNTKIQVFVKRRKEFTEIISGSNNGVPISVLKKIAKRMLKKISKEVKNIQKAVQK